MAAVKSEPVAFSMRASHLNITVPYDHSAEALKEAEIEAEIEDLLKGCNQPTYGSMRINGQRVATWSSRDGRSGDTRPDAEWIN